MGKNKGKLRKKPAGKDNDKSDAPKANPPSFLPPPSSGSSATMSLGTSIEGLPKTPSREIKGFDLGTSTAAGAQGKPRTSVSEAGPLSTNSSPPHDAAAVLSALAAKSPRAPSPRPPTSPHKTIASHSLQRDPSDGSEGKATSIHSTTSNAPSVIRRDGKGVSFMPSSPHAISAFEQTTDPVTAAAIAERPTMGRSASGAAREIVSLNKAGKGKKREVKGNSSGAGLRTLSGGQETPEVRELDDPITKKEVDEMMERGQIEVGKDPVDVEHEEVKFIVGEETEKQPSTEAKQVEEVQRDVTAPATSKIRRADSGRKDFLKSPSLVPQKRELEDVPSQSLFSEIVHSPRPKRRTLLDEQHPSQREDKDKDSEDERVVPDHSSETPFVEPDISTIERNVEEVYVPPYKPRKKGYTPQPLASSASSDSNKLAVAVSATITRHSTIPFSASRRVELRLAWKEPKNWLWLPGRKYIPHWDLEYVVKGQQGRVSLVRGLLKSSIGWIPVVGRFVNWI